MCDQVSCFPVSRGLSQWGKNESLSPSCDFLILISPRKEMRNERKGERKERQRNEEGRGRKWERGNNRKQIDSLLPLIFALLWENSACREASCSLAPQTHCTCTIIACSSTKTWPFMLCHDSHNGKDYYTVWIFKLSVHKTIQHLPWEGQSVSCRRSVLSFAPKFLQYPSLLVMPVDSTYECKTWQNATFS